MKSNITITFRFDTLECAQCSTCLSILLMFFFFIITLLNIVILDLFISLASDETQHNFFEDLMLYICKGYRPLSTCKNVWL
jgi:hypothetical protein